MSNLTTLSNDELIEKASDWVMEHLGFCRCGEPDWFVYNLYLYLERIDERSNLAASKESVALAKKAFREGVAFAYICDKAEWTDHGSSICHPFLTIDGKELLKKLRRIDWSEYESC